MNKLAILVVLLLAIVAYSTHKCRSKHTIDKFNPPPVRLSDA